MKLTPLKSSNIAGAHYDAAAKRLTIEFHSGGVHSYDEVPPHHYSGLLAAISAGKYFHAHIRGTYKSTKLPPAA